MNPVVITYENLKAASKDDNASAYMTTHIPTGINSYDQNKTYLYGRVVPSKGLYKTDGGSIDAMLFLVAYCDQAGSACLNTYHLGGPVSAENLSDDWHTMVFIDDNNSGNTFTDPQISYGRLNMNNHHYDGVYTPIRLKNNDSISPTSKDILNDKHTPSEGVLKGVPFKKNGTILDTKISMVNPAVSNRPTTNTVGYYPEPYLLYYQGDLSRNEADARIAANIPNETRTSGTLRHKEFFRNRFLPAESIWTGKGKTGHTVGDDINRDKTKRVEW